MITKVLILAMTITILIVIARVARAAHKEIVVAHVFESAGAEVRQPVAARAKVPIQFIPDLNPGAVKAPALFAPQPGLDAPDSASSDRYFSFKALNRIR